MPSNYFNKTTDQVCQYRCFVMFSFCWEWVESIFCFCLSLASCSDPLAAIFVHHCNIHNKRKIMQIDWFVGMSPTKQNLKELSCRKMDAHLKSFWSYSNSGVQDLIDDHKKAQHKNVNGKWSFSNCKPYLLRVVGTILGFREGTQLPALHNDFFTIPLDMMLNWLGATC